MWTSQSWAKEMHHLSSFNLNPSQSCFCFNVHHSSKICTLVSSIFIEENLFFNFEILTVGGGNSQSFATSPQLYQTLQQIVLKLESLKKTLIWDPLVGNTFVSVSKDVVYSRPPTLRSMTELEPSELIMKICKDYHHYKPKFKILSRPFKVWHMKGHDLKWLSS